MKMHVTALSAFLSLTVPFAATAATVDFTDGVFTPVTTIDVGSNTLPIVISEESEGVTFTITPTARGFDRTIVDSNGFDFGVPGNGMFSISIVASEDVKITSITGVSASVLSSGTGSPTGGVPFAVDYSAPGYGPFNIGFATVESTVGLFGGGVELTAGEAFLIDHSDFSGINNQGTISAIGFEKLVITPPPNPIPLPAGLPLLLAGLGGFAVMRRRQR
ncbi:MAG: VPLPA-CTERM sorting domain-containing protein [Pseudomonadota bacterium]